MTPQEQLAFEQRVDATLQPPAGGLVAAFYDPKKSFAGETFDLVGRNPQGRVVIDDLLAITTLDVHLKPPAIRLVLETERRTITRLLRAIPSDVPLWEASSDDLDAAAALWDFFDTLPGVGWVTAGKLLARKRADLIPIYDSVVQRQLNPGGSEYWEPLRKALTSKRRRKNIDALKPPGISPQIGTLRILDSCVWMRYSEGTPARKERLKLGLPVSPRQSQRRPPTKRT